MGLHQRHSWSCEDNHGYGYTEYDRWSSDCGNLCGCGGAKREDAAHEYAERGRSGTYKWPHDESIGRILDLGQQQWLQIHQAGINLLYEAR